MSPQFFPNRFTGRFTGFTFGHFQTGNSFFIAPFHPFFRPHYFPNAVVGGFGYPYPIFGGYAYPYDVYGGQPEPEAQAPPPTVIEYRVVPEPRSGQPYGELLERGEQAARASEPKPQPAQPQPTTLLLFNDGRTLEIQDYAIVGPTLFNLGEGGPRKIALADLNVPATVKANEDRGVEFSLPR